MNLIGQKIFAILRMLIFPATEICAELCCQSTWGHLPQLSAKFEPWVKHLSVFDMKQQYILKLILLRVSLCSVKVSFHEYPVSLSICCYVLHICPHALVTQKWWQNVSRNLSQWILVPLGGGRGGVHVWKAWCRIGLARRKLQFSNNILLICAEIKICAELCCQSTRGHLP